MKFRFVKYANPDPDDFEIAEVVAEIECEDGNDDFLEVVDELLLAANMGIINDEENSEQFKEKEKNHEART